MKRDQYAAGHRWENKVPEITVSKTYDETMTVDKDSQVAKALETIGYDTKILKAKFTVTQTEPKFI